MSPVLAIKFTVPEETGAFTFILPALTVKVPVLLLLEAFVIVTQLGQFCKVTCPEAVSLTFTLPLSACKVRALAFTVTGEAAPIEPLLLTSATAAALPDAPLTPLPDEAMLPFPAVLALVCKKNVPALLTVDGLIVTVLPAL
jgi:hypothetical protein